MLVFQVPVGRSSKMHGHTPGVPTQHGAQRADYLLCKQLRGPDDNKNDLSNLGSFVTGAPTVFRTLSPVFLVLSELNEQQ